MSRNGITADMLGILQAPTPADRIHTRPGPGGSAPLSYVTARFVMDRLDELGSENWQDRYEDRIDGSVRGGIGILVDGEWVWKWDVGTESNIESDKGSYSDAFKRAGVKWGIGRDLYPEAASPSGRVTAPAPSPRPMPSPPASGGAPEEPDFLKELLAEENATGRDPGVCPAHNQPWRKGKFGWYCSKQAAPGFKGNDRGYCDEKPSVAWIGAQAA